MRCRVLHTAGSLMTLEVWVSVFPIVLLVAAGAWSKSSVSSCSSLSIKAFSKDSWESETVSLRGWNEDANENPKIFTLLPAHLYAVGFKYQFNVLWQMEIKLLRVCDGFRLVLRRFCLPSTLQIFQELRHLPAGNKCSEKKKSIPFEYFIWFLAETLNYLISFQPHFSFISLKIRQINRGTNMTFKLYV